MSMATVYMPNMVTYNLIQTLYSVYEDVLYNCAEVL